MLGQVGRWVDHIIVNEESNLSLDMLEADKHLATLVQLRDTKNKDVDNSSICAAVLDYVELAVGGDDNNGGRVTLLDAEQTLDHLFRVGEGGWHQEGNIVSGVARELGNKATSEAEKSSNVDQETEVAEQPDQQEEDSIQGLRRDVHHTG